MAGKATPDRTQQLERARAALETAGFEAHAWSIPGDPERVIAQFVVERDIDVLVMGAYSHSPLRSLFVGSKTSGLLRSARIPTLLLR
jgi:nucleotide-binding universal stress UspA family protein